MLSRWKRSASHIPHYHYTPAKAKPSRHHCPSCSNIAEKFGGKCVDETQGFTLLTSSALKYKGAELPQFLQSSRYGPKAPKNACALAAYGEFNRVGYPPGKTFAKCVKRENTKNVRAWENSCYQLVCLS